MPPARTASNGKRFKYQRHQPEQTLLYQLVERHYDEFQSLLATQGTPLPSYVQAEFDAFLTCGRLEHGFLRVQCEHCHHERLVAFSCKKRGFCPSCGARRMADNAALLIDHILPPVDMRQWVISFPFQLRFLFANYPTVMNKVLGIVTRLISTHLIQKGGAKLSTARTGAVTFIQRFGSALNLNVHFHMLFLDGIYMDGFNKENQVFRRVKAPTTTELNTLVHKLSQRVARFLTKQGLLVEDIDNSYLNLDGLAPDPMQDLHGHSITYRVALGAQRGKKVFTLQTLPAQVDDDSSSQVGSMAGFSLHAGVATRGNEREKLERVCRYIARPALSEKRLTITGNGNVRYQLKTPYRDGTTHVIFTPLDFMAKLAALVPKPRVNLTRFFGVFAPNSQYRMTITKEKKAQSRTTPDKGNKTVIEKRHSMTWAKRLKRVFNIDIETCEACQGQVKVIACIEDPEIIKKILEHLKSNEEKADGKLPQVRAPPVSVFALVN
jgi:hypothetical protein